MHKRLYGNENENAEKLYKILEVFERSGKDKKKINSIRKLIDLGNLEEALTEIRKLNNSSSPSKKGA